MIWACNLITAITSDDKSSAVKAYLIGIVFLFIIFYLIYIFLKTYRKGSFLRKSGHMKLIDSLMLTRESAVYIVKVCDKYLMLGASGKEVSLLMELDSKQFDELEREVSDKTNKKGSFSQCLLDKLRNRGEK